MNVFELTAKLVLETEDFVKGLTGAKNEASSFGSMMGKGLKTAVTVGAEAIAAASTAVVAFGKNALDASVQYETAFAQVQTIMDTSQMSVEDMSDAIKELSSQMGISTTELSNTVYNAISATGDTANAVELAGQASMLATAGFTDTASALGVLTTAMNAYGESAGTAEEISDSLIMVQNLGVTTVSELSSSMGKAIASASAYGVDLANVESAYVSLTKAGISTAEATTYMSSMMKELGDDGSDVSAILQDVMGKSFSELMADGKDLADVLEVLIEETGGDSAALMNLWGSAEAGKAANAILSQGLDEFSNNLETIKGTTGATQKAYETMANTFEHKTEVIGTSWTNFMASMGDGLNSLASENGGILDLAIGWIDMLQTGLEENGVQGVMDAISTILSQGIEFITSNLPMVLNTGVDLLLAVIDGIVQSLPQVIDAIIQVITSITDKLTEPDTMNKLIESAILIVGALIEGIAKATPVLLESALQLIISLIGALLMNLPQIAETGHKLMEMLNSGLLDLLSKILQTGKDIITKLISGITNKVSTLRTNIVNIATNVLNWFKNIPNNIATVGGNIITGLWNGINGKVEWIKQKILGFSNSVLSTIKSFFGIASPSKVFKEVGGFMAEGLGIGWDNEYDSVRKQIEDGLSMDLSTNITSSSQGTAMNEELELMREQNQLLQQLLQKEFGIAGSDLFRSVRESAKTFEKSTGLKAFA